MIKNCIAVLTKGYKSRNKYHQLILRNTKIFDIIVKKMIGLDIIIFHEGNISEEDQKYIQSCTPKIDLKFVNVKNNASSAFQDSNYKINYDLCPPNKKTNRYSVGYKHMCHFWTMDFIQYLKNYKYIIRIDEDCILEYFDIHILDKMLQNNIYFGYPHFIKEDDENCIIGLENFWNQTIKKYNIKSYIKNFIDVVYPYTNFSIIDMQIIISNEYINKILNDIDSCGCIYSNRWGDLPIWGMIISTLFDKKHYTKINEISYYHGSHKKYINKNIHNSINNLSTVFLNNK